MPNRLLHRCLILSLAGLLFLLHGGLLRTGKAVERVTTQTTKGAKKSADQPEGAVVKAALDEAVVSSALSFDFSQVTYLLFTNDLRLLLLEQPLLRRLFDVPLYCSSYLRQVLGNLIAPNAP